jgi:hypothetical protein
MDYNEIKDKIQNSKIIVTGPHFSGTGLCAIALANHLGYSLDNEVYANVDDYETAVTLLKTHDRIILQAPALCHKAHELNAAIILMIRPFHEIVIDENKHNWQDRKAELLKYGSHGYNGKHRVVSIVKYDFWYRFQRSVCQEMYEVDYYSLPGVKLGVKP